MELFNYIIWSPNPDILSVGFLTIRWYGLLFAMGFIISQQIMFYIFKKEGKPEKDVETLTIFMVVATIIGARLGHVLFYQPDIYLADPIKILKIWEGGLASHGATIGILTALFLYSNYYVNISFSEFTFKKQKREGQSFLWIVDRIVIVVALTGCLIRFGNLMNSEIIGIPTGGSGGFVFGWDAELRIKQDEAIDDVSFFKPEQQDTALTKGLVPVGITVKFVEGDYEEDNIRQYIENRVKNILANYSFAALHFEVPQNQPLRYDLSQDRGSYVANIYTQGIPRHPAQFYESISSLLIFGFLFWLWSRRKENTIEGKLFAIFLIVLFGLRFVYEFFKENQVEFEEDIPLNMGQWLSIPLIIIGIVLWIYIHRKAKSS